MTTILNDVVESHSLKVSDIRKLHKGQVILVYLLDRNIGDYKCGTPRGTRVCTRKYLDRWHLIIYTHDHNLTGTLHHVGGIDIKKEDWTWEINITQWEPHGYWSPLDDGCCGQEQSDYLKEFLKDPSKIPGNTKVGWRGPAILMSDISNMPHMYTHYDTCDDDYFIKRNRDLSSFKTVNRLTTLVHKYRIYDNGRVSFFAKVYTVDDSPRVEIYKSPMCEDESEESDAIDGLKPEVARPFFNEVVETVFVGESHKTKHTEHFKYRDNYLGNSLLLHRKRIDNSAEPDHPETLFQGGLEYIFVGRSMFSFEALSEIVNYFSPMGGSLTPRPYAIDTEGRAYLMDEKVIVQLSAEEVQNIP